MTSIAHVGLPIRKALFPNSAEGFSDFGSIRYCSRLELEDIRNNNIIVVDHPTGIPHLNRAILAALKLGLNGRPDSRWELGILDYLKKDEESGSCFVVLRDPFRKREPRVMRLDPSFTEFGKICFVKTDNRTCIQDVQSATVTFPQIDTDLSALGDMLNDRSFSDLPNLSTESNPLFPLVLAESQTNGPNTEKSGLRCFIPVSPYDRNSEKFEYLEGISKILSPYKQNEKMSFEEYQFEIPGEGEDHTIIPRGNIDVIRRNIEVRASAYRGTFSISGCDDTKRISEDLTRPFPFDIDLLDSMRKYRSVENDPVLIGSFRALSLLLSFMPVGYKKTDIAHLDAQTAQLELVQNKVSSSRDGLVGGSRTYKLID